MINPSLHINKVFREQVQTLLRATFHKNTMETIRDVIKKKDTCVTALIMFYESKGTKPKKVYRLLSCVLNSLIYTYFCLDYISCKSKTLSRIASNRIFEQTIFNTINWY